ncbi:hypothetical protein DSL72_003504 [Monilinia vaccinii-corymbosi]|uniref:Phosphoribosyltransferase domain-containing protein n=1 Tax=Monilinia vaccinii-corymbosi TaxID=61207 RepID=A0A8A3NTG9_9HELO|nr:hypothetical protein DSL72_003504 [Monilinia vaccinii-corymbosi]
MMASQTAVSAAPHLPSYPWKKGTVVGLYGISGCGKSFLLEQLKERFEKNASFVFIDGSELIAQCVSGGLEAFQKMDEAQQKNHRKKAIKTIRKLHTDQGRVVVIAGHFMLWDDENADPVKVWTSHDSLVYTHIIYLDIPVDTIQQYRHKDDKKYRSPASTERLREWMQREVAGLGKACPESKILFTSVHTSDPLNRVSTLLYNFKEHSEPINLLRAKSDIDDFVAASQGQLETVLVIDGDKTLVPEDTGELFWQVWMARHRPDDAENDSPLKTLFKSGLGYSYTAFRQATLIYEELMDKEEFEDICHEVASIVRVHSEFVSLLHSVAEQKHIGAVIISCGLRCIWKHVLEGEGLSKSVKIIAGGRIADGIVVTPGLKASLVNHLRHTHRTHVFAFGDSPLDLDMLKAANNAYVVVGEVHKRSKTMEVELLNAIDNDGLRAFQVMLPENASPRLDTEKLPVIKLTDPIVLQSIFRRESRPTRLQISHATGKNVAKLLMTPTRDATNKGPALRDYHRSIGRYLAIEFISEVIGVESYEIPHVQGHQTIGHRLLHESQTLIVALMRGGEPMALGVNDAFPLAMFLHAKDPMDVMPKHLHGNINIILVDSVINSGRTIIDFVHHIRRLNALVPIIVVAGVVQAQSIAEGTGILANTLIRNGNCSIVTLRISDNKFTGQGVTDTGDRLFNTTHI